MAASEAGSSSPVVSRLKSRMSTSLVHLHPAYFALVMATGIVGIASGTVGLDSMSRLLLVVNLVAYPVIWFLFVLRLFRCRTRFLADLSDHARAPGFFTVVAATGVLGSQLAAYPGLEEFARALWFVGLVLWSGCTYTVFTLLTIREAKPDLSEGINGSWLVAVVATQSVTVLGCALDGTMFVDREPGLFLLLAFWLGGGMLYLWIISLIFYRYMFFRLSPDDLMPPYWINMGAVAISTLAGALLAHAAESSVLLAPLRPFIIGTTVTFWATATWWIPILVVLGAWRHIIRKKSLKYNPLYWGLVFPIGMYSACTYRLGHVLDVTFLSGIATGFAFLSLLVWSATMLGLLRQGIDSFRDRTRSVGLSIGTK